MPLPFMLYAVAVVLLNTLSFASLAYVANRKGHHALAALAAAGACLFGADVPPLPAALVRRGARHENAPLAAAEAGRAAIGGAIVT
jgi:hypothetical protein